MVALLHPLTEMPFLVEPLTGWPEVATSPPLTVKPVSPVR
jgi:hypothetical protein